jgi:thioredoxin-like negative regulator of GroEL
VLSNFFDTAKLPHNQANDHYLKAISALFVHDLELALQNLIETLKNDPSFLNGFVKNLCIALFTYLGETNNLTIKYRKILSSILF